MNKTSYYFSGLVLVIYLGLLGGCSMNLSDIGVPIWSIEATVPFSEKVYRLSELITDSTKSEEQGWGLFVDDADSLMKFEFKDSIDYLTIDDRLTYSSSEVGSYTNNIGLIHIEEPFPDADTIKIAEVNPDLQSGYNGPIPPFTLEQAQDTLVFNIFNWVAVREGRMYLTLINDFPFDLENVRLALHNVGGDIIGEVNFGNQVIPPLGQAIDSLDLSNQLITNNIAITANAQTPGTGQEFVQITGDEQMLIVVGISETDVDSANAEVAEQDFMESSSLDLEDDNKILEAVINTGEAFFRLRNTTRFKVYVDMIFPDIVDGEGAALAFPIEMDPLAASEEYVLDLSGRTISMPIDQQRLRVENRVRIEDSRVTNFGGSAAQTITGDQGVDIDYWVGDLMLHSMAGILYKVDLDIPEQYTNIDLPKGLDNINFTRDTLFVGLNNETELPLSISLEIIGSNSETGETETIPVRSNIVPGYNRITIPDVDRLTEVVPDSILVKGTAQLGVFYFPENSNDIINISEDDGVSGRIRLKAALRFSLEQTKLKTKAVSLAESLNYDIEQVLINVRMASTVPLGGVLRIMMGNDTTQMDTIIRAEIPRGEILNNHRVDVSRDTVEFELDREAFDIMKSLPLYTQQEITLYSSNTDTVFLFAQDSVSVQAFATVRYRIDLEPEDGNGQ